MLRRSHDVLMQFETHARGPQRATEPIDKDRFVRGSRLSPKQRDDQIGRFWPQRADAFLASFAK
jgi:hypothetical protein